MSEYNIEKILRQKSLNRDEIEQLAQTASWGGEQDLKEFKAALVSLGIYIVKGQAERSKLTFDSLMEFVDLSWFENRSDKFSTYFQFEKDASRYVRQAKMKAMAKKSEEKGEIRIPVVLLDRIQKLSKEGPVEENVIFEEVPKCLEISAEELENK